MAESRFERWSRLKSEARQEAEVTPEELQARESAAVAQQEQQQALADNEQLSDEEILQKYELPDPDKIELGMDIKGFMNSEIPEALRRRALRSLWRSNPVLAVLDGLNDYDEDYHTLTTGAEGVQTLYQVGKGMFDKALRAEEKLQQAAAAATEANGEPEIQPEETSVSSSVRPPETLAAAPLVSESVEGEAVPPEPNEETAQPVAASVRYRPRMSFS